MLPRVIESGTEIPKAEPVGEGAEILRSEPQFVKARQFIQQPDLTTQPGRVKAAYDMATQPQPEPLPQAPIATPEAYPVEPQPNLPEIRPAVPLQIAPVEVKAPALSE